MTIRIVPSILAADFGRLAEAVQRAEGGGADAVQIDVMDGHFVPNLTFGAPLVRDLRGVTSLPLDVHLMIANPEQSIDDYAKAGADILTIHVEATVHAHRLVQQIREAGMAPGIALNPATPLVAVEELLDEVAVVLVMTVNPGFGGQAFIPSMVAKVRRLREMLTQRELGGVEIEVDGGVNPESASRLAAAGATWFVAGSAVFGSGEVAGNIARLRARIEMARVRGSEAAR